MSTDEFLIRNNQIRFKTGYPAGLKLAFLTIGSKEYTNCAESTFFILGKVGTEIHSNVKSLDNEKVIVKHYPNSFIDTELQEYLAGLHIFELVI